MNGLFIVYHGFSDHSGISKKIFYQCDAFRQCGIDMRLCHLEIAPNGTQRRMVDDQQIRSFGRGLRAKIEKRVSFGDIERYVRDQDIRFVYIRHDFNANPATIRLLRGLKRLGVRIALEIPTYPYDAEFADATISWTWRLRIEKLCRRRMARYVDRIVTFSEYDTIFGRPTIRISNGIDFSRIPLKAQTHDMLHEVHLLAVANIHFWHGFDRAIEGLRRYYATPRDRVVKLRIVGDGARSLIAGYKEKIREYGLEEQISVLGARSGAALDAEFEWADMGIASLGRHRCGIRSIKTLKNREYAARGIPFVYSETDEDFETMPYVLKAPADNTPLDIANLLRFYDSVHLSPAAIRATIESTLSWDKQMKKVLHQLFEA